MISLCVFSGVVVVLPLCLLLTFVAVCVPPCPSPVSSFADENKISDAGARALAEALQGSQLKELYLCEYD